MTAEPLPERRTPLLGHWSVGSAETAQLRAVPWRTLVELRITPGRKTWDADIRSAESALGLGLPLAGRNCGEREQLAVWLGPGWWLLDAPEPEGPCPRRLEAELVQRLREVGRWVSAVEVSAGYVVLELTGPCATSVLAHGCSIDLHPRVFGPGRSARTTLAKAEIVLAQFEGATTSNGPAYRIWVRSSFSRYLAAWLVDAAKEYLVT